MRTYEGIPSNSWNNNEDRNESVCLSANRCSIVKENETQILFPFFVFFFPAGKETEFKFTLCSPFFFFFCFFFVTFKKTDFKFSFSFFVFVWNFENGVQVVLRFSFSANGSKTDNLCLSGNI